MELKINLANENEFKAEIKKALLGEIKNLARSECQLEFDTALNKKLENLLSSPAITSAVHLAIINSIPIQSKGSIEKMIRESLENEVKRLVTIYEARLDARLNKMDDVALLEKVQSILKSRGITVNPQN